MRLFIALNFSDRFRAALNQLTRELAAQAVFCRPTPPENHHLTLSFIGESQRAEDIGALLQPDLGPAFTLATSGLGRFRRQGGDVVWLGLTPSPPLRQLQSQVEGRLRQAGFALEKRAFRPHITLLRGAVFPQDFDLDAFGRDLPSLHQRVLRVSLMESRREQGGPVYVELRGRDLD